MAQRDYYEVLNVSKSATPEEITKRYRELVMKYHPDLHKNDPGASKKMSEINEAYEVLSDPEKRKQYDVYGAVGEGVGAQGYGQGTNFGGGFGGGDFFGGVEDILRNFGFGGGFGEATVENERISAGSNIEASITISLSEAVLGTEKDVKVTRNDMCSVCHGSGVEPRAGYTTCSTCKGSGVVRKAQRTMFGEFVVQTTCPTCHGEGKIPKEKCHNCVGNGIIKGNHTVQVKIPPGVENGMRVRVRGQGNAGRHGGPPGDLYVFINVIENKTFTRVQDKIYYNAHISVADAVLGTVISVPLIEGNEEKLKIPLGTQSNSELVIRGRGGYAIGARRRGDLIVKIQVDIPISPSSEEVYYFEKLREIYNARRR